MQEGISLVQKLVPLLVYFSNQQVEQNNYTFNDWNEIKTMQLQLDV